MRNLFLIIALFLTQAALASDQPRHIVSVGTDGLGLSAISEVFDWNSGKSGIKDDSNSVGSLKLNYNYVFDNRVMLGGEVSIDSVTTETKFENSPRTKSQTSDSRIGISVGYNFGQDLYQSWWIRGIIGSGNKHGETKIGAIKTKKDFDFGYLTISGGRRISLQSWGLKNVTYNPSLSITSISGDGTGIYKGLDGVSRAVLDIVRIDILF